VVLASVGSDATGHFSLSELPGTYEIDGRLTSTAPSPVRRGCGGLGGAQCDGELDLRCA
jgi:hypothetical protein